MIPAAAAGLLEIQGSALGEQDVQIEFSEDELVAKPPTGGEAASVADVAIRLADIAGYGDILDRIEEAIIWPEKHRRALRRPSRSSGILFFGPPGCGKSRLARAIAGELQHEVRLVGPSDLRGAYIGWGQILIREQFDWVAERERRMLVIDELDAVARSRRDLGNMHEDEKASVNELLVQLDRVTRLGRLVVGTTNYVDAIDEAVVRSGRFGNFVPVPPPDIDAAIAIVGYYLRRLATDSAPEGQPLVRVPDASELRESLVSHFAENRTESRYFCCADLEEAVNRTYLRCLRNAMTDITWSQEYSKVTVKLTTDELRHSLQDVPKSVTRAAIKQFLEDVDRFCGCGIAEQVAERLGAERSMSD